PLWGNLEWLRRAGLLIQETYGSSLLPPFAIALLLLVAGVVLTWRFLVGGLWLGLSGNKKAFVASTLPYASFPFVFIIGLLVLSGLPRSLPDFTNIDLDWIPVFEVIATLAVIVKFALWVFSWRDAAVERADQYFFFWAGGTVAMLIL